MEAIQLGLQGDSLPRLCFPVFVGGNFFNGCNSPSTSPVRHGGEADDTLIQTGCGSRRMLRLLQFLERAMLTNHLPADWLTATR